MKAWWEDLNRRAHWDRIGAFAFGALGGAFVGSRVLPKHRAAGAIVGALAGCGAAYGAMVVADPTIANL